jgi:hypothetical protein
MALINDICDAIWEYETRTLLAGDPLADPTTALELICDACWRETVRTLTSEPPATEAVPRRLFTGTGIWGQPKREMKVGS